MFSVAWSWSMRYWDMVSDSDGPRTSTRNCLGKKSRTFIKKLIDDKHLSVNGETVKPHYIVRPGD